MKLLPLLIAFIFIAPFASAFEIGGFEIKDGNLTGKYFPSGLEGCVISCYSNTHVLDMIYKNKSIDITFEFLDDPMIKKLIEWNSALKEEMQRALMNKTISIAGPSISFNYEGCRVELHDSPTRFLKIYTTKIVIHNGGYGIKRIKSNEIKLEKDNFTSILMSTEPMEIHGKNITAYHNIMLVGFSFINEKESIENAFVNKTIGGEISIAGRNKNETDFISYFGNVTINATLPKTNEIVLKVSGNEGEGGKVIKVNLAKNVCLSDKIIVRYDGKIINEANNLTDILNPNDDGSNPEYYKLASTKEGVFLLISIPHFSQHEINIEFIVRNPIFQAIALLSGIAIVGLAALYLFKK